MLTLLFHQKTLTVVELKIGTEVHWPVFRIQYLSNIIKHLLVSICIETVAHKLLKKFAVIEFSSFYFYLLRIVYKLYKILYSRTYKKGKYNNSNLFSIINLLMLAVYFEKNYRCHYNLFFILFFSFFKWQFNMTFRWKRPACQFFIKI